MNKRHKFNEQRIVDYTKYREINDDIHSVIRRKLQVTNYLIDRLGLEAELIGHDGCVNTLEWSDDGKLLVSASDDTKIIIWDPLNYKVSQRIDTVHEGNIFTARFLPKSGNTKIVTGAADHQIAIHDVNTKEAIFRCNCPTSRVKRIETCCDILSVFWCASEDGIIRQIDSRAAHKCNKDTKNILINLTNHTGNGTELKCLAINQLRTELLAVGANDPFVRLYDRRMVKISSFKKNSLWYRHLQRDVVQGNASFTNYVTHSEPWVAEDNLLDGCAQYFIPGHLQIKSSSRKHRQVACTYVTFSPDGRELLANLGSEQIYLFDITRKHSPKYFNVPYTYSCNQDYEKNLSVDSTIDCDEMCCNNNNNEANLEMPVIDQGNVKKLVDKLLPNNIEKLKDLANEHFRDKQYSKAIKLYNRAIQIHKASAVLYGNRAAAYLKRDWKGDKYAALRDCFIAVQLDPNYMKGFFRLTRCLNELHKSEEARDCLQAFKEKFQKYATSQACRALEKDITNSLHLHKNERKTAQQSRLSCEGMLLAGTYLGLQVSTMEKAWQGNALDYEQRYCGHCNTTTDIKEANFFGSNGQYIVAGSDEGSIYFWDRYSENIVHALQGDTSIVNCLQPHPSLCLLATSGIDPIVRLWSPRPEDGSENERVIKNIELAAETNQVRMQSDPFNIILGPFQRAAEDDQQMNGPAYTCATS